MHAAHALFSLCFHGCFSDFSEINQKDCSNYGYHRYGSYNPRWERLISWYGWTVEDYEFYCLFILLGILVLFILFIAVAYITARGGCYFSRGAPRLDG
jgi:hypothetical protein